RGADPGGLRDDGLRSGLHAQRRRHALRARPVERADDHSRAGLALLAGVPRRAGPRGRAPEDRLGLRSRVPPARAAAGVRSDLTLAGPWVLAHRIDQIGQTREIVEPIADLFHARDPARAQHNSRQLAKLRPDLARAVRILIVAARALAEPRHLAPVGERDGHPRGLESWHVGAESGILAHRATPSGGADRGYRPDVLWVRVLA